MERNEAIKVIKSNYPHVTESGSQFETALRLLIPELKESEDERIRLKLIEAVKGDMVIGGTKDKQLAIAWLEKHGEKKPIDKIQIGKKYKCIASPRYSTFFRGEIYKPEDEFLCSLMNFCSDCFEPIEDGEQKPVEPEFVWEDKLDERLKREKEMQKPAWSEEDKRMIDNIIFELEENQENISGVGYKIDWLKALKDRYTWKPSDEQIMALNYVVNIMASSERPTENDLYYNILKSLREQLRKLRE